MRGQKKSDQYKMNSKDGSKEKPKVKQPNVKQPNVEQPKVKRAKVETRGGGGGGGGVKPCRNEFESNTASSNQLTETRNAFLKRHEHAASSNQLIKSNNAFLKRHPQKPRNTISLPASVTLVLSCLVKNKD